jgi:hypothetical protein
MSCMMCYELQQALLSAKETARSVPAVGLSAAAQRNGAHQAAERVTMVQLKLDRHMKLGCVTAQIRSPRVLPL